MQSKDNITTTKREEQEFKASIKQFLKEQKEGQDNARQGTTLVRNPNVSAQFNSEVLKQVKATTSNTAPGLTEPELMKVLENEIFTTALYDIYEEIVAARKSEKGNEKTQIIHALAIFFATTIVQLKTPDNTQSTSLQTLTIEEHAGRKLIAMIGQLFCEMPQKEYKALIDLDNLQETNNLKQNPLVPIAQQLCTKFIETHEYRALSSGQIFHTTTYTKPAFKKNSESTENKSFLTTLIEEQQAKKSAIKFLQEKKEGQVINKGETNPLYCTLEEQQAKEPVIKLLQEKKEGLIIDESQTNPFYVKKELQKTPGTTFSAQVLNEERTGWSMGNKENQ